MKSLTKVELEVFIYTLIQEYLQKNRFFCSADILPFLLSRASKSSININLSGIKRMLQGLIEKNLIVEKSKLLSKEVLSNENRAEIYSYIKQNPGIYFFKIVNDLELTIPVVRWHLNLLEKFNFIKKENLNNRDFYYERSYSVKNIKLINTLLNEKNQKIINYLLNKEEGVSNYNIAQKLKMHQNTVSKYLKSLIKYKLIKKMKISNKILFLLEKELFFNIIEQFQEIKELFLSVNAIEIGEN